MTGLSLVRMISHVGVRLRVRPGRGGHPTERWQDKSRSLRPDWPAADGRKNSDFARCAQMHDSLDFRKSPATSVAITPRTNRAP
jgi:hypothetical protein